MKIPKKVKVGPHIYKIKYEEGFLFHHNKYAQTRNAKTEIILDPEVSETQLEDSFLHELLHAIDNQIAFTEKDKDEEAIARLTPMLLDVLKDNKLLK